ncbi:MAG: hypothetical protein HYZ16_03675 [Bacteroidetes bacterium]|nr:hypothetical protein [Bacteroidota bacterium]
MRISFFFLKLHARRWYRYLSEIGLVHALFVLGLVVFGTYAVWAQVAQGRQYIALIVLPLLHSLQYYRRDHQFLVLLGLSVAVPYRLPYLVLALPFLAMMLAVGHWAYLALSVAAIFLLPLLHMRPFLPHNWFLQLGSFLPYRLFEWRCGLRQYGLAIIILWLAGAALSVFPVAVPIVLFFLALNTSVFQLMAEPKEMLTAMASSPGHLLRLKAMDQLALHALLTAPLVALDLWFHPQYWYIVLYVVVIGAVTQVQAVVYKYSLYRPGQRFESDSVFQLLVMSSFLVPFLLPIPFWVAVANYKKSIRQLTPYF